MDARERRDGFDVGQFSAGVLLLLVGGLFLFDRFDLIEGIRFGQLWPVLLIYFGLVRIVWPRKEGSRRGGAWMLMIGALFLLHTFRVVRLHDSWPMFIVFAGVLIIWQAFDRRDARPTDGTEGSR
jgi:uncharacterized membrane protein HdeD (DUF308 family)